ncbi:MAG: MFS transporter [Gammaproteobacteria bacterium]|nr:MFS transporter [Gammaproteobacteria bacterium]MCH9744653.1 MFS transporter [Gammaproteobacteria bacterium]
MYRLFGAGDMQQLMKDNLINVYIARCLSSFNLFLFVPFFPVWLSQQKLLSSTNISIITALIIISLRSASLLLANIVKKYPKKHVAIVSMFSAMSIFLMLYAFEMYHITSPTAWYLVSILLGIFIAITSLALMSVIALNIDKDSHQKGFSYMNIALNLSAGLGPLLGSYVLHYHAYSLPLIPIIFSVIAIAFSLKIPKDRMPASTKETAHHEKIIKKSPFWWIILANVLTYLGYAQFYDIFPIYAHSLVGIRTVGFLFLLSSIVIISLQAPSTKIFEKFNKNTASIIGNIVFAIGIFMLMFSSHQFVYISALGVIILSIGEVIFVPFYQSMVVSLDYKNNPVLALAIMMAAWGVGESIATFFGVYTSLHQFGHYSYVLGTCAILAAASILFFILRNIRTHTID